MLLHGTPNADNTHERNGSKADTTRATTKARSLLFIGYKIVWVNDVQLNGTNHEANSIDTASLPL